MLNYLRRLFAPPIFADEEKMRVSQFMVNFTWTAMVIVSLLIVSQLALSTDADLTPVLIFASMILLLAFIQYIVRLGYVYAASIIIVFGLWGLLTYLAWRVDGLRDLAIIACIVVLILSSFLLGLRFAALIGIMTISVIWYFGLIEKLGLRSPHFDDPISYARDLTGVIILIGALIYQLIMGWSRTLQAARVELKERLRTEEKLQRQADYLIALNDTALGLLNRSELQPLLESILTRACDLLNTQHGLIDLVLPDESALRQDVGHGVLSKYNGTLTFENEGVTGNVWVSGQPLIVQDYRAWDKALSEFINAGFNAVMGVPLKVRNNVIGVLAISYVEQDRAFTQDQVRLMEQFAALAALAIDNARLFEQAQNEIRERTMAEAALRASEERFRKIFQASPVATCITTLDTGRLLDGNNAYWKLSGLDPQKSIGRTVLEMGVWYDETERKKFAEQLNQEHSLYDSEYQFINIIGESISTLAFYELVQLDNVDSVLSMFYDITEQKNAQESLQNSEARTRAILASIPDMIFEISKDGTFLDFMASAEMTPLMLPSQFLGKNVQELFPPVIAAQTFFALERALDTVQLHAFEYGMPSEIEERFFEARITAITSESAIFMVRDISQRKYVQFEREKLINELEGKNTELERFTYTVSHDLKSPLITIKGFLGFLEQDAINGNTVRLKADIQRIADAADKMQLLLNELLELSRIGRVTNPYQINKLEELVHQTIETLHGRLHEKNINVIVQKNLPVIYGDKQRLLEVLQNLVDNAAKFTGTSAEPSIEIGHDGFENGKPILYIKDNGLGIEAIHHERIFGLFNKLDAKSDGTGIGLALVRRIIEVHGGRIWVQSEAGSGSTFFFTLPVEPES